jgi:hypothetical protein
MNYLLLMVLFILQQAYCQPPPGARANLTAPSYNISMYANEFKTVNIQFGDAAYLN